jgi:DNA-binding transcriptional ArsR family regulator
MDYEPARRLGDILKDKNIILKGADAATAMGFTQVPNFLLKSKKLSSGDKMTFAMLLSYAWQNDFCFPGQERLAEDLGLSDRSVRTHLKALEANALLVIKRRGQGRTNLYELILKPRRWPSGADRKKTSGQDRQQTSALERKKTSGTL